VPFFNRHTSNNKSVITRISDELWKMICNLLPDEKSDDTIGRPAVPSRKVFEGIFYVLRTECQWKMLPKEFDSSSTCPRWFQQWVQIGIFKKIWVRLLKEYNRKEGIKWTWQSLDNISIKSPLGGSWLMEIILCQ
jgi:putative transposase